MRINISVIDLLIEEVNQNVTTNETTSPTPTTIFNRRIEIAFAFMTGCIIILGFIVNFSILKLFFSKRQSESLSSANLLLGNLAGSNCIAIVMVLPVVFANIIRQKERDPSKEPGLVCDMFSFFRQLWWISNIYTLLFISYDRYKSISCPLIYRRIMTSRKAVVFIIITWTIAIILSMLPMVGWTHYTYDKEQYYCSVNWDNSVPFNISYAVLSFWTPCVMMVFCYSSIIWNAKGNIQRLATLMEASNIYNQSNSRSQSIYKTVKTSCLVVMTFLIAWLPYFIMVYFHHTSNLPLQVGFRFCSVLIYTPVLVYPYLFAFRNKTLRVELCMLYAKISFWRQDVRKIHPAPNIDEEEYPENVSRRNSRTESRRESQNMEKRFSRQSSSIMLGMYRRESGMTSVEV